MVSPNGPITPSRPGCLVVDDELSVLSAIELVLSDDFTVYLAQTGATALDILRRERVHLVALDLKLPDVYGLELLPQIQEIAPEVPVIIITGHSTHDTVIDSWNLGAVGYLTKPFTNEELLQKAQKALLQSMWIDMSQAPVVAENSENIAEAAHNLNPRALRIKAYR